MRRDRFRSSSRRTLPMHQLMYWLSPHWKVVYLGLRARSVSASCYFESFPFRHSLLILRDLTYRISFSLQSNQQLERCLERGDPCQMARKGERTRPVSPRPVGRNRVEEGVTNESSGLHEGLSSAEGDIAG